MARPESRIWSACAASAEPSLLGGTLHRVVESQQQVATRGLVDDDLERQQVLERLLESSKPSRPPGTERLDYLLATPWRYPPLRHGSRFGAVHEPSLFYGGLGIGAVLAETAYYRLVFREDTESPPPVVRSRHTMFEAKYRAERGLRLHRSPFDAFSNALTHRTDYTETQALGSALRDEDIEAIEFASARDPDGGLNVALFVPSALVSTRAERRTPWLCATTDEAVVFRGPEATSPVVRLARERFLIEGVLPRPA